MMKRVLVLLGISLLLCSTASAFQGGGGESTKKASTKKKAVTKKNSGTEPANTRSPAPPPRSVEIFGPSLSIELDDNVKLELVLIKAGSFQMGSDADDNEKPVHRVTISQPFYLGKYEVTQAQWQAVMGHNPSYFKNCGGTCPIEQVSWDDAQDFIKRLNAKQTQYTYRLPTEAEWEYAARAERTTVFAFGDSLSSEQGNFNGAQPYGNAPKGKSLGKTVAVGSYQPNAWGLHDMHGNVWEWCQDRYSANYYKNSPAADPQGPNSGSVRVFRGGSWSNAGTVLRSAHRHWWTPDLRDSLVGFRVVGVRSQSTVVVPAPAALEFPTSGSGRATREVGLKAYLDPLKTHTRPSGPARYVFVGNSSIYFDEDAKPTPSDDKKWWSMAAGNYIVYPRGVDEISFTWWHDN